MAETPLNHLVPEALLTPIVLRGIGMFITACTNKWDIIVPYLQL